MRDLAIAFLKEHNKNTQGEVITLLYYSDNGDYVEDLSYYANSNYMSDCLLDAIQNGQSLTTKQLDELKNFTIEKRIAIQDIACKYTVTNCKSVSLGEKGLIISAENVEYVPCKYKWEAPTEKSNVATLLDNIWEEVKERIQDSNKANTTQNITINIENPSKDFNVKQFAEEFTRQLKRQQGVR